MYLKFKFVRVFLYQFVLFQICYNEICSSLLVDVGYQLNLDVPCVFSLRLIFFTPMVSLKIFTSLEYFHR